MPQFDRRYFYASDYRTARIPHRCTCGKAIAPGQLYLYFVPREYEHVDICLACSVKKSANGTLHWPCNAVRERIWHLGPKAGEQEHEQTQLEL